MTGEAKRSSKVASRIQEEIASALRGLDDPRVAGVVVSRVEVTDDLQSARVYVRHRGLAAGPAADDQASSTRKALLRGLEAASGRLRRTVARAVALRYAPSLRFFYDEGPDAMSRVEDLLREIKREGDR
jgi:ribosome-binding factor A